jgi:HAD superfamily hydrolase (TIGR01509 family)
MRMSEPGAVDAVVFDAMGVLYASADDVADLLIPYLRSKGSVLDAHTLEHLYRDCSLGKMSSARFWEATGALGASDTEYCRAHRLTPGITPLLANLKDAGYRLACLSNDVSEWSTLLRDRFRLTNYITDWVISADIGIRKPDPQAYAVLCRQLGLPPHRVLFIDDRPANIAGAHDAGLQALRFGTPPAGPGTATPTMEELGNILLPQR